MKRVLATTFVLLTLCATSVPAQTYCRRGPSRQGYSRASAQRYARAQQRRRYRSSARRNVYYTRDRRSFWQRHRDKLTVAVGAGSGAAIGGLAGGRRGALVGALLGGVSAVNVRSPTPDLKSPSPVEKSRCVLTPFVTMPPAMLVFSSQPVVALISDRQGVVMWKLALAAVLGVVFAAASAHAQSKETLRGIAGVRVSVTIADGEARKDGLPEGALRAVLEERARSAGLRLTDDSMAPRLSLVVNTQKYAAEGVYAVAVDLDLYQLVSLARADAPPFHASTWRVTQVFVRATDDLGSVRAVVERAADAFVKDFLTANGRQP